LKILYLTNNQSLKQEYNDIMSDLLLHGLRELLGENVVDFPGSWFLYKDESIKRNLDNNKLWGKGFSVKNILNKYSSIDREDIESKIKKKYFDLIIYSSARRAKPFLDEVIRYNNRFIFIDGEDDQFIDEDISRLGLYFKRELMIKKSNLLPLHFAVPKNNIIKEINPKPKNLLAPLIPGRAKTYVYENEKVYNKMYEESIFALTYKKGGWDCFRHYEILMNGCLPLFLDIENCPENTMTNFPKMDMISIKKKYSYILKYFNPIKTYNKKFINFKILKDYFVNLFLKRLDIENFIQKNDDIFELKQTMLQITKSNLTTEKLGKYILEKIN